MAKTELNKKVAATKRLITTCKNELLKSDGFLMTIRGVENLTHSEVDTIIFYCNYFVENKTLRGSMPPTGSIATVLRKINLIA